MAANDEADALGSHASVCHHANGWRLSIGLAFDALHAFIQPRLITVTILVLIVAAAATLLFT